MRSHLVPKRDYPDCSSHQLLPPNVTVTKKAIWGDLVSGRDISLAQGHLDSNVLFKRN